MSTMRSAILAASTLGANNILRDHLQNLNAGGSGDIYIGGVLNMDIGQAMSIDSDQQNLTMNVGQALVMNLDANELNVSIGNDLSMEF